MFLTTIFVLASIPALALAHGNLLTPPSRLGGAEYAKVCRQAIATQDKSDLTQEVQTLGRSPSAACDLFLCKGYKFEDVALKDVQHYAFGEKVNFVYDNTIPHPASDPTNVTIIDTRKRQVISDNLFFVPSLGDTAEKMMLPVQLPTAMKSGTNSCTKAGDCVLALNWDAKDINQTFQSCVDFVFPSSK